MEASAAIATKLLLPRLAYSSISTVRSDPFRCTCAPRALVRRTRRSRRKSIDAGDDRDDLFSGDGWDDDGPFGGSGGSSGGGRGWNFWGDGGVSWEDDKNNGPDSDPAFDFVYGVVSWFALSSCTHFAVKKLGRMLEERGKFVPSMC